MSAYRELVYRAAVAWGNADLDAITSMKRALAEVFRTLENSADAVVRPNLRRDLIAWLRASPLAAPAEKETEG